jgi:hypothetical protein
MDGDYNVKAKKKQLFGVKITLYFLLMNWVVAVVQWRQLHKQIQ